MTTFPASSESVEIAGLQSAPARAGASRLATCWALYWLTLRQHLHGKRWIAAVLLFLVPAGLAMLFRVTRSGAPSLFLEFVLAWILVPQALLPLVSLLYASGIIQDEQEEQTITYLIVRPIPKWLLYIIKMAATWTTTIILVVLLILLTYAAIYAGSGAETNIWVTRSAKAIAILSLAAIAYCGIFGLIGVLTRRTLIVGILYTAIIEGALASFPLSLRLFTVIYYTRMLAYRSFDFVVPWPNGRSDNVAAATWFINIKDDPKLTEHPEVKTCILILLSASLACTLLAAWKCSRSEFHVKTPEKQ
jgi:ABC-2 type transport system permease protein